MLSISAHQYGESQPLFAGYGVTLPGTALGGGPLNLAQLLGHLVRAEVAAYNARRTPSRLLGVFGLDAPVRANGQGDSGSEFEHTLAAVLWAFRNGEFLVVIDGLEATSLDTGLAVNEDSRIALVRLTTAAAA